MNTASPSSFHRVSGLASWPGQRAAPLATILVLHAVLLLALRNLSMHDSAQAKPAPREVSVSFVTPEPAPEPPKPKTVPVVKKQIQPPVPVVRHEPSPQALATPPANPAPPEPAAPAAPAPSAPPAPPSPPAPAPAQPRTITSGIQYLQAPQPVYPSISKRMGEEGKAVLRVLVNDKGRPERVEIQQSTGFARLDEAARQAALRALFKPFVEDGKAVAAYAVIPIRFQLDN